MPNRKTLACEQSLKGIGLHTGEKSMIVFRPAADGGIVFRRADLPGSLPIPARLANVTSTVRGTNLKAGTAQVYTVEHVLSSCAAFGVTDLEIIMDGPEPPVADGSAKAFTDLFLVCGTKELPLAAKVLTLPRRIEYRDGDVIYVAKPASELKFSFLFTHNHPLVSRQEREVVFSQNSYLAEIAPARTFGFEEELSYLRENGLAKGGSLDNAVVITKTGFAVNGGLRYQDELVRHKILDMIGDFALCGVSLGPIHIHSERGGHKHNVRFAEQLLAEGVIN